jgi:cell division protease FtsH
LSFELSGELKQQIYNNSVFPAQGTRPVFSSIHAMLSAPLVNSTLWALERGAKPGDTLTITVDATQKQLETRYGGLSHCWPVVFELDGLKQRTDANFRALLAVHEAGHALVYSLLFGHPPQEVKINAASFSGGYNSYSPMEAQSARNIIDKICVCVGGLAAESMVFGNELRTSGSESDIEKATQYAAQYVRHLGFGKRLGKVDVASQSGEDLNTDVHPSNQELEAILQTQFKRAETLLAHQSAVFLQITQSLELNGQLTKEELATMLNLPAGEVPVVFEPYAQLLRQFGSRQGRHAANGTDILLKAA